VHARPVWRSPPPSPGGPFEYGLLALSRAGSARLARPIGQSEPEQHGYRVEPAAPHDDLGCSCDRPGRQGGEADRDDEHEQHATTFGDL